MSEKKGIIGKAVGIGAAVAAIAGGAIYLGRKIFHKDRNNTEEPVTEENEEESEEDTEEESEEE